MHYSKMFTGAVVVIALIAGFFLLRSLPGMGVIVEEPAIDNTTYQSLSRTVANGSYESAIIFADQVQEAQATRDPYAQGVADVARFMAGREQRLEAVRSSKKAYAIATDDIERAINVNRLLEFMVISKSPSVFDEVFNGQPFAKYKAGNDFAGSIHTLAKHSFTLNPTSVALWYIGVWPLAHVRDFDVPREASDEEKKQHEEALLTVLTQAELLYGQEFATRGSDVFALMIPARYWYWRGYTLGALARIDEAYLQDAEVAYSNFFSYVDATRDDAGDRYAFLEAMVPAVHIAYALDLLAVSDRDEDVALQLDTVISLVTQDVDKYRGFIDGIGRVVNEASITQEVSMANLQVLASAHRPFAEFLGGLGLVLEE